MKETELAEQMIKILDDGDFEIFQEVQIYEGIGSPVVDIVAKQGNILWSIETKTSFSMDVLAQAFWNKRYFHYSSVCISHKNDSKARQFAFRVASKFGIGVFVIWPDGASREIEKAKFNRKAFTSQIKLNEQQKTYAKAGNNNGSRWSPFQQTKENLIRYVTKNEGDRLSSLVAEISHHYNTPSTAAGCIRQWINNGVIKELRIDRGRVFLNDQTGIANENSIIR